MGCGDHLAQYRILIPASGVGMKRLLWIVFGGFLLSGANAYATPITGLIASSGFRAVPTSYAPLRPFVLSGLLYSVDLAAMATPSVTANDIGIGGAHPMTGFRAAPARTSSTADTANGFTFAFPSASPVTEPATLSLLGMGLLGTGWVVRRRRRDARRKG
jgi:PEP-CTERM motif-containing protein